MSAGMGAVFPDGIWVRVGPWGAASGIAGYGELAGLAVIEKATGEPLQRLSSHSNAAALVSRWDAELAARYWKSSER